MNYEGGRFKHFKAELMQMISVKIQKKGMLRLSAGARFTNFKTILMQVIIGSVINLKKWSNNICGNTKKGTLSAEGGRTINFKAILT